jgi:hypothetical protein
MTGEINLRDPEGRPHGVWEDYYLGGPLWWRRHYLHGKRHGLSEWYKRTGTPYFKSYSLNIK